MTVLEACPKVILIDGYYIFFKVVPFAGRYAVAGKTNIELRLPGSIIGYILSDIQFMSATREGASWADCARLIQDFDSDHAMRSELSEVLHETVETTEYAVHKKDVYAKT